MPAIFFAPTIEPLHRNQFGATLGGNRQKPGLLLRLLRGPGPFARSIRHRPPSYRPPPSAGEISRGGIDTSTGQPEPLINEFTGMPFPGNQIPAALLNPISLKAQSLIPLPNVGDPAI